ncbi:hypothetical protein [Leptospira licerasiae]|uniref:hypothetical protein n=1 Tax=Leptospira licerasiae TaxID=447106 RepID=UPI00301969AF
MSHYLRTNNAIFKFEVDADRKERFFFLIAETWADLYATAIVAEIKAKRIGA